MRTILPFLLCFNLLCAAIPGLAQDMLSNPAGGGGFDDFATSSSEDEFLPVEEAYQLHSEFEARDGGQQLRLNWDIAEGYYLYRHGFRFTLTAGGKTLAVNAQIPDGKEKQDDYFGTVQVYYHGVDIYLADLPAGPLALAVTSQGCADAGLCYPPHTEYFQLDSTSLSVLPGKPEAAPSTPPAAPAEPAPAAKQSLPLMMLLAMLGGIILNLMPCVFPVLSLKVLGFANDKGHSPVVHGLTYSAGVVFSFVAVAAILVSLQAAGQAVGWGFHLQSPWFVAALCYLFFVMGLGLSGFIELGSGWMNIGGNLAARSGYGGSFFTGILATVVASPCTAPFMGTALGFAVTQPTAVALLVFAALGVGMALPVLVLSCSPALLKHIPKPGPWMDSLKQILAFPLYATAIWLAWVVGNQTGVNGMALVLLGCLLLVIAIWYWRGKALMRAVSIASGLLALSVLGSSLLQPTARQAVGGERSWQPYSALTLQQLRDAGKPVFVNVTADWCITCLTNEKVTLSTERVQRALQDNGFTYLKGDWTNYDSEITALLSEYGRTGIPLYLVYGQGGSDKATVLPQLLTVDTVVNALTEAGQPSGLASAP